MVASEETGDYRNLRTMIAPPQAMATGPGTGNSAEGRAAAINTGYQQQQKAAVQAFGEPAGEILSWTYQALHSPERAGIVPVAISWVDVQGSTMTVSPFQDFPDAQGNLAPLDIPSSKKTPLYHLEAIVFDWEGVQYLYNPDVGTHAKPLPLNPLTGLPYLCVKNGGLLECAYFCATYAQSHPGAKTALLSDDPVMAAYPAGEKLGLFIPSFGRFTLPKDYLDALDDLTSLAQLRDQLLAMQKAQKAVPDLIPDGMPGDDRDLQARRAFLAFQAAGVPSQLHEEHGASMDFTWNGVAYTYGPDQQVHSGVAATP